MPDRPTGTVTFLFADIEGSTALAQQTLGDPAASTAWAEGGRWELADGDALRPGRR